MDTTEFRYCPFCSHPLLHPGESNVDAPRCAKCEQGFYSAPHPTVPAIIVNKGEGQVLLARRQRLEEFGGLRTGLGCWSVRHVKLGTLQV